MGGTPDIPDPHVPGTIVELSHMAHIHPAQVFAHFDLVMWTHPDPPAPLLKGGGIPRIDHPFANPFALIRPDGERYGLLPVIDDFKKTTGYIPVVLRWSGLGLLAKLWPPWRELYLNLCTGQH